MYAAKLNHVNQELMQGRLDEGAKWMEEKGKLLEELEDVPARLDVLENVQSESLIRANERRQVKTEREEWLARLKQRLEFVACALGLVLAGMALWAGLQRVLG